MDTPDILPSSDTFTPINEALKSQGFYFHNFNKIEQRRGQRECRVAELVGMPNSGKTGSIKSLGEEDIEFHYYQETIKSAKIISALPHDVQERFNLVYGRPDAQTAVIPELHREIEEHPEIASGSFGPDYFKKICGDLFGINTDLSLAIVEMAKAGYSRQKVLAYIEKLNDAFEELGRALVTIDKTFEVIDHTDEAYDKMFFAFGYPLEIGAIAIADVLEATINDPRTPEHIIPILNELSRRTGSTALRFYVSKPNPHGSPVEYDLDVQDAIMESNLDALFARIRLLKHVENPLIIEERTQFDFYIFSLALELAEQKSAFQSPERAKETLEIYLRSPEGLPGVILSGTEYIPIIFLSDSGTSQARGCTLDPEILDKLHKTYLEAIRLIIEDKESPICFGVIDASRTQDEVNQSLVDIIKLIQ